MYLISSNNYIHRELSQQIEQASTILNVQTHFSVFSELLTFRAAQSADTSSPIALAPRLGRGIVDSHYRAIIYYSN